MASPLPFLGVSRLYRQYTRKAYGPGTPFIVSKRFFLQSCIRSLAVTSIFNCKSPYRLRRTTSLSFALVDLNFHRCSARDTCRVIIFSHKNHLPVSLSRLLPYLSSCNTSTHRTHEQLTHETKAPYGTAYLPSILAGKSSPAVTAYLSRHGGPHRKMGQGQVEWDTACVSRVLGLTVR